MRIFLIEPVEMKIRGNIIQRKLYIYLECDYRAVARKNESNFLSKSLVFVLEIKLILKK